jgi:hypothetical protein
MVHQVGPLYLRVLVWAGPCEAVANLDCTDHRHAVIDNDLADGFGP